LPFFRTVKPQQQQPKKQAPPQKKAEQPHVEVTQFDFPEISAKNLEEIKKLLNKQVCSLSPGTKGAWQLGSLTNPASQVCDLWPSGPMSYHWIKIHGARVRSMLPQSKSPSL